MEQQVTAKDEEIASLHSKMSKLKEELNRSNQGKWAEKKATNDLLAAADDRARVAMERAAECVRSAEERTLQAEEDARRTIRSKQSYQEARVSAKKNDAAKRHLQKDALLIQALLEAASHSKEEKKLLKSGQLKAALSEKRLVALRNAKSRIRELQDMLADESAARKEESVAMSAARKEQSVALADRDATIQELEDTIIEL